MTTLHDRLAALADEAPRTLPETDLWERGVRYHRRRRGGTLGIVAAATVVLALVLGVAWQRSGRPDEIAPADAPVGLPDRLYAPSRWLPGTDDAGPLGRLVAVIHATRATWTDEEPGLVGVSATTGEYRFLDLPDWAAGEVDPSNPAVALSPDGRRLAYWTGTPDGSPDTSDGLTVTGFAIYDAQSGETQRHEVETEHGLLGQSLLWADSDRLLVAASAWTTRGRGPEAEEQRTAVGLPTLEAVVGRGTATTYEGPSMLRSVGHVVDGVIVVSGRRSYRAIDLRADRELARFRLGRGTTSPPVVNPSASRVAAMPDDRWPAPLVVGGIPRGEDQPVDVRLRRVPGEHRVLEVITWVDEDEVVVRKPTGRPGVVGTATVLERVAVTTGASSRLTTLPPGEVVLLAPDLLVAPTRRAAEPPSPLDPRLVTGLAGAIVVAAGLALLRWRRRVQP